MIKRCPKIEKGLDDVIYKVKGTTVEDTAPHNNEPPWTVLCRSGFEDDDGREPSSENDDGDNKRGTKKEDKMQGDVATTP